MKTKEEMVLCRLRYVRFVGVVACALFSLLLVLAFLPLSVGAELARGTTGAATASVLTFTSIRDVASVSLAVSSVEGSFATSVGDQTAAFSISTNNYTGYTVSIAQPLENSEDSLINEVTNQGFPTLTGPTAYDVFSGTGSASQAVNNHWGYIPSYYYANSVNVANSTNCGETNCLYFPAPAPGGSTTMRVTGVANSEDGISNADEYTIGLGLRADYTYPSGIYRNSTLLIQFVANSTNYSINYAAGDGISGVSGLPSATIGSTSGENTALETATLSSVTPARTGYTFANKWCLGTLSDNGVTCTGTEYASGAEFGIDKLTSNADIVLYAIWTPNSYDVTVNFADANVASVVFTASGYDTRTVSTSGGTASLAYGVPYTVTANFNGDYMLDAWTINNSGYGTLSSATVSPAIFSLSTTTNSTVITASSTTPCAITFKSGDGTGSDYVQKIALNHTDYISGNDFTYTNHYFKGWSTSSDASTVSYRAGQVVTLNDDMTLYAVWGDSTTAPLYDIVASLNNGRTLTNTGTNGAGVNASAGIQADITKENSGVFLYDTSVFGVASDAADTNAIYLYRGILDDQFIVVDTTGDAIGASGDSANYPNYVRLGDTCWRIIRTTGSGGVKMIYNGGYSSTCAHGHPGYPSDTIYYNDLEGLGVDFSSIVTAGYTFNSNYLTTTADTAYGLLFGTNSSYSGNSTDSTVKNYLEDTWFSKISAYESILEGNAGYCNDRSLFTGGSAATMTQLSDSTNVKAPYLADETSGLTYLYFGGYYRNASALRSPSLGCARDVVDLYTVNEATGGNGQLVKPIALPTADEMSFAGSGRQNGAQGSAYSALSFTRVGAGTWLLTPNVRPSTGSSNVLYLNYSGRIAGLAVNGGAITGGASVVARPVISLAPGTMVSSGSGTAADPWVVDAP